ncbi:MAG: DUF2845 domain-containing protein [Gammaproteobacteria bacterium]|nr:DUF2845 domain-containing protein [Gammaproteobacteria bacterium]
MDKIHLALITLLLSTSSYALMCPNNFKQIDIGDTIEQVEAQCGKPTSQSTHEPEIAVPQQWTYNIEMKPNPINQTQTTLPIIITLDEKGIVTNITVNGSAVSKTTYCDPNGKIAINKKNTDKQIIAACGKPVFITKGEVPDDQKTKITKVTESVYSTGASVATLVFENGQLQKIN